MKQSWYDNGVCVRSEEVDLEAGTFVVVEHGVEVERRPLTTEERILYGPQPLDPAGVVATLNVVLGLWPIEDAANAVGLTPADLEAEALAWSLAAG